MAQRKVTSGNRVRGCSSGCGQGDVRLVLLLHLLAPVRQGVPARANPRRQGETGLVLRRWVRGPHRDRAVRPPALPGGGPVTHYVEIVGWAGNRTDSAASL